MRPSWKLGLRLEWGAADVPHFNYPFERHLEKHVPGLDKRAAYYCLADPKDCSVFHAMMDRNRSPATLEGRSFAIDPRAAYHLPNARFVDYLRRQSLESGASLIEDEVQEVVRTESGDVDALRLQGGREVRGDLFIDCSGFRSLLLGETLAEPYVSYADTLFCDRAVIGSWQRDDQIQPYTTASTMDHGWAWRIDFPDVVTRGYVFSSAFCSDDDAARELQAKNPQLGEDPDLRVLRFPSGRYARHWVRNVVAVGNAAGFVEPLEATALHCIVEQLYQLADGLIDADGAPTPGLRDLLNAAFQRNWDDVRDFLALHYKFNYQRGHAVLASLPRRDVAGRGGGVGGGLRTGGAVAAAEPADPGGVLRVRGLRVDAHRHARPHGRPPPALQPGSEGLGHTAAADAHRRRPNAADARGAGASARRRRRRHRLGAGRRAQCALPLRVGEEIQALSRGGAVARGRLPRATARAGRFGYLRP